MPPSRSAAAKKRQLTLAQLASYDDILTDALVDQVSRGRPSPARRPPVRRDPG